MDASPSTAPPLPALAIRSVSKSFGGVHALQGAELTVLPGEVHGLLGENGSGKSTLIKILAGFHAPDAGELYVHGERVKLPLHAGQFRALGLDFVHQDLALIPALSVVENLRVAEVVSPRHRAYISWSRERRRARQVFARYGITIAPEARVADLSPVDRALLAIVRAIEGLRRSVGTEHITKGVLVLDEPTVFLPRTGVAELFKLVREIAANGASVLFVSHDLDEVREITDRVTVLRDGRVVGTVNTRETNEEQLVEMIIGRHLDALVLEHHDASTAETAYRIDGLRGGALHDLSLALHAGEVLGVTGLAGSGFEELPYLLFGAQRAKSGNLTSKNSSHDLATISPTRALREEMALLPGDRQGDGSIGSLSVTDNITLQRLKHYFRRLWLHRREMVGQARQLMTQFDVRPSDPRATYSSLSGGNQQKALLAKWLQMRPKLLLLHEPTQGVDVGARQQIFSLIRQAASEGTCVLCASSDHEQLAAICDRVIVIGRGRIFSELKGDNLTKDRITEQCFNSMAETVTAEP
jgi:ribose transport system ATP-binding protein